MHLAALAGMYLPSLAGAVRKPLAALFALTLVVSSGFAQRITVAVVTGGYANDDFVSQYVVGPQDSPYFLISDAGGYVIGTTIEVGLRSRVALAIGGLYKPLHYKQAIFSGGQVTSFAAATVVTWQFPFLVKYTLPFRGVSPFVEMGPSFRSSGNENASSPSYIGVTAGLGLEKQWRTLRIAPRIRYTRWTQDPAWAMATRADQFEFLVGFGYAAPSASRPL